MIGVNDDGLKKEHRIISNASCTTNCLSPMAKVLKSYDMIASKHKWTCSMCGRKLRDGAEAKERK